MRTASCILLLIILISTGCTSSQGFDRAAMGDRLYITPTSQENQPLSPQSTRLSPPFRLGVIFAEHNVPNTVSIRKVEWLSIDRDHLLHQLTPLRDEGLLVDTFVIMDVTVRRDDIKGIRQTGARFGADLVVIIDGIAAIDRYNNRLAWLYPTLIGAYVLPGTESDALVMATGNLLAVHSDWHAPIQTVEGQAKVKGSAAFVEDATALQEAKQSAIQALGQRIADQLQSLK
jgi:rhombotail lipoprotein